MSASGSVLPQPLERATVRRLLAQRLVTDADFNAFCLDHFPAVQRRFSAGLNRLEKENLLLELIPAEQLAERLAEQSVADPVFVRNPRNSVVPFTAPSRRTRIAAGLMLATACLTAASSGVRFLLRSPAAKALPRLPDPPSLPLPPLGTSAAPRSAPPFAADANPGPERKGPRTKAGKRVSEAKKPDALPGDPNDVYKQILR